MAERRRLFLEEMARIRERERRVPEETHTPSTAGSASRSRAPALPARPAAASRSQAGSLALIALCLALIFPIWGYIQSQAAQNHPSRAMFTPGDQGPDSPEWRLARLQRVRAYFGLPGLVAVTRDRSGFSFVLRPGLSHASVLAQARRIQTVLSGHTFPPRGPLAGRIGVCSGSRPCSISVIYRPGPGDLWYVSEGGEGIKQRPDIL